MAEPQLDATTWGAPPTEPELAATMVHVWRIDLDRSAAEAERLAALLAPDERERAARFRFARDRQRFVAGRVALRAILARYLGATPQQIVFAYGVRGKPELAPEFARPASAAGAEQLQFNIAHAAGLALVAVAAGCAVGVDVEALRPLPELEAMIDTVCAPAERAALRELPAGRRLDAFFEAWTRKEAVLKARGDGLSAALDGVKVALGHPARLLRLDGDLQAARRWWLRSLAPAPGFVAALALASAERQLSTWQWPGI